MVSVMRRGRSVTRGLLSASASCVRAGATRSTGSRIVASMRLAVSADLVICGITVWMGSSMSSSMRFIRCATALRLSMRLAEGLDDLDEPGHGGAELLGRPGHRGQRVVGAEQREEVAQPRREPGEEASYRAWRETLLLRTGRTSPRGLGRRPAAHPTVVASSSIGGHEQTRWRSPAAASMRLTGGKYFVTRSPSAGKAASSRG